MIKIKHAYEPTSPVHRFAELAMSGSGVQEQVVDALVIQITVVVSHILTDCISELSLAE
jgi:uncharacterized protein YggE